MSLEVMTAGMLALRGLGMIRDLLQGDRIQRVANELTGAQSLTEAEFHDLMAEVLGVLGEGTGEDGDASSQFADGDAAADALRRGGEALSPLLFDALDRDGSGALEAGEIRGLQRLVARVADALDPAAADDVRRVAREALT